MNEELKHHVIELLKEGMRLDGRKPLEYRKPIKIEKGIIETAGGSARATIGETEVIVGIKFEVGTPYPDKPDEGTIICGAELLPLSNPEFESGPPGIQAIELARVIDRGIRESSAIDFKKLCIEKGEKVWLILIDICPINDAGNLLDASSLATLAALQDAKFPVYGEDGIDYKAERIDSLKLEKKPIEVTVHKIGEHYIIDPTTEEEKITEARLTVAVLEDNTLCAMQKGGECPLKADEISKMIDIALDKAKEMRGAL